MCPDRAYRSLSGPYAACQRRQLVREHRGQRERGDLRRHDWLVGGVIGAVIAILLGFIPGLKAP